MNKPKSFRHKIHRYLLNKQIQHLQVSRSSKNLDAAKTIGILFENLDLKIEKTALNLLKELSDAGKKVAVLGYIPTKEEIENKTYPHFNKKSIDYFFRPKGPEVEKFINTDFDILIDLSHRNSPWTEYICALSKAKFRVGPYSENTNCYDLMIECQKASDTVQFITQLKFYLGKMNSKKELSLG